MDTQKICPNCGKTILTEAKKCKYCREWVEHPAENFETENLDLKDSSDENKRADIHKTTSASTSTLRKCRSCGKQVDISAKSCPHCGCSNPGLSNNVMSIITIIAIIFGIWVWVSVDSCTDEASRSLHQLDRDLEKIQRYLK